MKQLTTHSLVARSKKLPQLSWPVIGVLAGFLASLILVAIFATGVSFASHGGHHQNGSDSGQGQNSQQQASDNAVFNCTLTVPNAPLSSQGLATPYLLSGPGQGNGNNSGNGSSGGDKNSSASQQDQSNGDQGNGNQQGCRENNMNTATFVEATIIDPATGHISIYRPVVVDTANPTPLIAPVAPPLPANAVVALDFGFGGTNLTLKDKNGGQTLQQANCINGLGGNVFGQVAYCNQAQFFQAASQVKVPVPALSMGQDGKACQTTNDPATGDMDPNDNTNTSYLLVGDRVAQNTAANVQQLADQNPKLMANASDTGLLVDFIDKALGCTTLTAPEVTNPNAPVASTTEQLSQLFASANQAQTGRSVNYIPAGDPMAMLNMKTVNLEKLTLLRTLVNQAPATQADVPTASTVTYCRNLLQFGLPKIALDKPFTQNFGSPNAMMANNLFTFLANRFMMTFGAMGLNCTKLLDVPNPVKVQMQNNVVVAAKINLSLVPGGGSTGSSAPTGAVSVTVDGAVLTGTTATINGATATIVSNGPTITITSSLKPTGTPRTPGPGTGTPAGVSVVVDGTPLTGNTATINGAPATIVVTGMAVTISSTIKPTSTNTVTVLIDGNPLTGNTAIINGAPATVSLTGTTLTITSSKGATAPGNGTGTPLPRTGSAIMVVVDGAVLTGTTATINGATATIVNNGPTITITSSLKPPPSTNAVTVTVDGTPLTGNTAIINGAPATVSLTGTTLTITSSVTPTGTTTSANTSGVAPLLQGTWTIIVDEVPLNELSRATVNGAMTTVANSGTSLTIASST